MSLPFDEHIFLHNYTEWASHLCVITITTRKLEFEHHESCLKPLEPDVYFLDDFLVIVHQRSLRAYLDTERFGFTVLGTFETPAEAREAAQEEEQERCKHGYTSVLDRQYKGGLTYDVLYKPEETAKLLGPYRDVVVACIDNSDLEDRFDFGIEYLAKYHDAYREFIVQDRFSDVNLGMTVKNFKIVENT